MQYLDSRVVGVLVGDEEGSSDCTTVRVHSLTKKMMQNNKAGFLREKDRKRDFIHLKNYSVFPSSLITSCSGLSDKNYWTTCKIRYQTKTYGLKSLLYTLMFSPLTAPLKVRVIIMGTLLFSSFPLSRPG